MKLSLTVVVLVLMQLSHVNVSTALSPICIERVPYYTAISYPTLYTARFITSYHECGHSWVRIRCPRIRNPVISKIAYKRIQLFSIRKFCCDGYRGTPPICEAICSQGCHNGGACVIPGICSCLPGWKGNDCRTSTCSQGCYNGGTCLISGICICRPGWRGNDCRTPICLLGCLNGGTCVSPGTCSCSRGWTGINCIIPICSQGCHNGGACVSPGTCSCLPGWKGNDCRTSICSQGCYNGGACVSPGTCICLPGWKGNDCNTSYMPRSSRTGKRVYTDCLPERGYT